MILNHYFLICTNAQLAIKAVGSINKRRYCIVSKNVQLIQNFNKIAKLVIKIAINAIFIKNPADVLGNRFTLDFKYDKP